jgi:hypothetical protein
MAELHLSLVELEQVFVPVFPFLVFFTVAPCLITTTYKVWW